MKTVKKIFLLLSLMMVSLTNISQAQCNVNASTCNFGTTAPFPFVSPGPNVSNCLDFFGSNYGYIMIYISQTGNLNLLINGNSGSGFLDVAIFNVPNGVAPCTAIQNLSNQISCNYASAQSGCNQFGNAFSCSSSVPAPAVTAGQTVMIVVENWSGTSTNYTLQIGTTPGSAQAGSPDATINNPGSVCLNAAPVQLTAVNSGGTWSGPGVSASGMFNPTTAGLGTHTINYSIGTAPCVASSTATVTVTAPTVATATPPVQSICSGAATGITLSGTLPGTTFSWTVTQNGVTGATAGSGSSIAQTLTNSGTTAGTAIYTITPTANSCSGSVIKDTVTVNPRPTVTATPATQTICSGQSTGIALTSNVAGTTYSWTVVQNGVSGAANGSGSSIAQTLSTTGAAAGSAIYTITPTANSCPGTSRNDTVIVNPTLTPAFAAVTAICSGATAPVLPLTSTNGVSGTWSPATVSNTASGTYTFTPTAGQCATTTTLSVTVNNNSVPTFNTIAPICNGATAPVLPATSTNGFTGTWSPATVSNTASGTYIFTPTAGQCSSGTGSISVTVNPNVTPAFAAIPEFCAGATAPVLPLTSTNGITGTWSPATVSNTASATYTFTPTAGQCATTATLNVTVNTVITPAFAAIPDLCSGATAPVLATTSTNNITGTWSPAVVSNTATGTYTFTPTAGQCALPRTITVTVNPIPAVTVTPATQAVCSGAATSIALTSAVTGAGFTWTVAQTGASGATAASGTSIAQTLTATGTTVGTVTYTITPTASGCIGATATATVTVNPRPVVTATPAAQTICSGAATAVALSSNVTGSTFAWTVTQNGVTGATAASGTSIAQTLTNAGTAPASATYTITPTANSCAGTALPVIITVNPKPVVTATPSAQTLCSGQTTAIALTAGTAGTTYSWTIGQTGVTGAVAGSGSSIAQSLSTTAAVTGTATYTITPAANSCPGNTLAVTVTVNTTPAVPGTITGADAPCAGSTQTYTVAAVPGTTTYVWTLPPGWTGTSATNSITVVTGSSNGTITVKASNTCGTSLANSKAVTATPVLTPGINVVHNAPALLCSGTLVSFTATATAGGIQPAYQWRVNGLPAGTNNSVFTYAPANGDTVTCTLNSNYPCVTGNNIASNMIIMQVTQTVNPSLNIYVPENNVCSDELVTFLATPEHGGTAPAYQWKRNNNNVGNGGINYSYVPVDGDVITCILSSNALCAAPPVIVSNAVPMSIVPVTHPQVNVLVSPSNSVPYGTNLTFTAQIAGEGPRGYQIRWYRNDVFMPEQTTLSWSAVAGTNVFNGNKIRAELHSFSNCADPEDAESNVITMSVGGLGIANQDIPEGFIAYPNPATGTISFEGLHRGDHLVLRDVTGRSLKSENIDKEGVYKMDISDLSQGVYLFSFESGARTWQVKVFKN